MTSRRATPQLPLPFDEAGLQRPASRREQWRDQSPSGRSSERVGREAWAPTDEEVRPPRAARSAEAVRRTAKAEVARRTVPVSYDRAHRLASELRVLVGAELRLHIHDNRSTMVSFRREAELLHLRVHHMFLDAGPEVVRALADYARARSSRAGRVLDHYVRQNRDAIKPLDVDEVRARPLRTQGDYYDLQEIYDHLNDRYFGGTVDARIGWGRGAVNRRRRSIRMGAYYHDTQTILIHPALDRIEVPRYFVELVIYHEMLHQAVPQHRLSTGRRCIHSDEFREREREFHEFERARNWERRNLSILLRPSRVRV